MPVTSSVAGITVRPSLSALDVENAVLDHLAGVAGITVPAFVERPHTR